MKIVANVIINADDEILILKRSSERKSFPDKWCFLSGTIEDGESPEDCSKREIPEELGNEFKFEIIEKGTSFKDSLSPGDFLVYPFLYRYLSGAIKIDREHSEYKWINRQDLTNYDIVPGLVEDLEHLEYFLEK